MRWKAAVGSSLFLLALGAGQSRAASIGNASFEAPALTADTYCITFKSPTCPAVDSWTGNFYVVNGSPSDILAPSPPIPDGSQFAMLQGRDDINQTISLLQAGTYELTWFDAGRGQGGDFSGNQTYDVSFGGAVLDSFSTSTASNWTSRSLQFFSGAGNFTLSIVGTTDLAAGVATDNSAFLDHFGLTLVKVPEPASFALVALGCAAVCARRRRPA